MQGSALLLTQNLDTTSLFLAPVGVLIRLFLLLGGLALSGNSPERLHNTSRLLRDPALPMLPALYRQADASLTVAYGITLKQRYT